MVLDYVLSLRTALFDSAFKGDMRLRYICMFPFPSTRPLSFVMVISGCIFARSVAWSSRFSESAVTKSENDIVRLRWTLDRLRENITLHCGGAECIVKCTTREICSWIVSSRSIGPFPPPTLIKVTLQLSYDLHWAQESTPSLVRLYTSCKAWRYMSKGCIGACCITSVFINFHKIHLDSWAALSSSCEIKGPGSSSL